MFYIIYVPCRITIKRRVLGWMGGLLAFKLMAPDETYKKIKVLTHDKKLLMRGWFN